MLLSESRIVNCFSECLILQHLTKSLNIFSCRTLRCPILIIFLSREFTNYVDKKRWVGNRQSKNVSYLSMFIRQKMSTQEGRWSKKSPKLVNAVCEDTLNTYLNTQKFVKDPYYVDLQIFLQFQSQVNDKILLEVV